MTMLVSGVLFLAGIAGVAAAAVLLDGKKTAQIICVVLCAVLAFLAAAFIGVTLYFGWAVRNQEPKIAPQDTVRRTWGSTDAYATLTLDEEERGSHAPAFDDMNGRAGTKLRADIGRTARFPLKTLPECGILNMTNPSDPI